VLVLVVKSDRFPTGRALDVAVRVEERHLDRGGDAVNLLRRTPLASTVNGVTTAFPETVLSTIGVPPPGGFSRQL